VTDELKPLDKDTKKKVNILNEKPKASPKPRAEDM
jgi:hypothetical protein